MGGDGELNLTYEKNYYFHTFLFVKNFRIIIYFRTDKYQSISESPKFYMTSIIDFL